MTSFTRDVAVIGGCGHVGLPLGLAFADRGLDVVLHDIDPVAVDKVNARRMPFGEEGRGGIRVLTHDLPTFGGSPTACQVSGDHPH